MRGKGRETRKDAIQTVEKINGKIFVKCSRCKTVYSEKYFLRHPRRKTGYRAWCNICTKWDRDRRSENTKIYLKRYYKSAIGLYMNIKGNCKYKKGSDASKLFALDRQEFLAWYENQPQECSYCKRKQENLGSRLGVDRKDSKKGYHIDNIVLCCIDCNTAKNAIFSYEEFMQIAQKYLVPKYT